MGCEFTGGPPLWKITDVKNSQSKIEGGWTRWIVVGSLAALLGLVILIVWQSRPARVVADRQADLIEGVERRSAGRLERLVADDYRDRWGFDADDAVTAIVDVGGTFLTLVVTNEERALRIEDDRAVVTARFTVGGKPIGPAGHRVTRRINQLDEPFTFTWERQNFLPWSWRLVEIDNPDLPDELYGYEPGDIRRAMRGE